MGVRSRWLRRQVLCFVALAVLAAGCGSSSSPDAAPEPTATAVESATESSEATATDEPTAVPAEAADDGETDRTVGDDEIAIGMAFIDSLGSGDHELVVSYLTDEYQASSLGTLTAGQFWTLTSRFNQVADAPIDCRAIAFQVECVWLGTDDLSRILGYRIRPAYLFEFDGDLISDIIYFSNDSETFVAAATWIDENHPGSPLCRASAEELDEYYGGPGALTTPDGEVFGEACATRMILHAPEYLESGRFIPPRGLG